MSDGLQKTKWVLARNCLALKVIHNLSEKDVEKKSGIAQKTFNNIINANHNPTLKSIVALAAAFKVKPEELLQEELFDRLVLSSEDYARLAAAVNMLTQAEKEALALKVKKRPAS